MAWSNVAEKLVNIVSSPIELVGEWLKEPLKNREHNRKKDLETHQEMFKNNQVRLNQTHNYKLRSDEEKLKTELHIKKETEVVKIISEIEELKKDKQLERMKLATESLVKLQRELTKINTEAISSIGQMSIDLRDKAHNLFIEKKELYETMQEEAIESSMKNIEMIDKRFAGNERAKDIFYKAEDAKLANAIDSTQRFISELSIDLGNLNKSIDILHMSGQKFIENHLSKFSEIGFSQQDVKMLSGSQDSNKTIEGTIVKDGN